MQLFARAPWERQPVVPLRHAGLGQNAPSCEMTPEGGQRCADGTYVPPSCSVGGPETIQGKPLVSDFPVVPVILAVAGVSAVSAILLSGNRRMGVPGQFPAEAYDQLQRIGDAIQSERSADAYNFSEYQAKLKEGYDLLEKERVAEANLAEQNRIWEVSHRNLEALQAAQSALDTISLQRTEVKTQADDYRQRVNRNSENIVSLRQDADRIISSLPGEFHTDARRMIDPCAKPGPVAMKGTFLGEVPIGSGYASGPYSGFGGFDNVMMTGSPVVQVQDEELGRRYPVVNR